MEATDVADPRNSSRLDCHRRFGARRRARSTALSRCKDAAVARYLQSYPEVDDMFTDIEKFIGRWLKALVRDHRSYVTVAIGCTGGQHRSVYLVEMLARRFGQSWQTLKRHRELDAR